MKERIPYVRAEGTAREIGHAHGERARALVASNRDLYFTRFREEWGLTRETVLERAGRYERVIRDVAPDYAEAMEGLAEGSEVPLADIVSLNARYELVYSEYSRQGKAEHASRLPSGCTAVGLLPVRTHGGRLLLAQNWDWISGVRGLVLHARLLGGAESLGFTEAGIVGTKIGMNDKGLGLLINGLVSDRDAWDRTGVPFHVRCWQVLQCSRLDDAVRLLRTTPTSCSANFLLGQVEDGEARVVDLEVSPVGTNVLDPEDGTLTHTNHFHRPDDLGIWEPLLDESPSTYRRNRRIDDLLRRTSETGKGVDVAAVQVLLQDHDGHPYSICRHPDEARPLAERYETVASIIMDLSAKLLWISQGAPCSSDFSEFSLDG